MTSPPAFGSLPGEFAIRTYLTNNYLTARDGGRHSIDAVITAATTLGPNERFRLATFQPDFTTIQTRLGYYVSALRRGGLGGTFDAREILRTERRSLADDMLFRLIGPRVHGPFNIGTYNRGYFLTALGGGNRASGAFHTDATVARTWEDFWVLKIGDLGSGYRYTIKPAGTGQTNTHHLAAIGRGGQPANAIVHVHGVSPQSYFTPIRLVGGSYALQTSNRINYVTAVNGGGLASGDNLHTDATQIRDWERFNIVDQGDATYTIQTISGFYLAINTGVQDGRFGISTRISDPNGAPQIGYTAKFELMMAGI